MFGPNSRYRMCPLVDVETAHGKSVRAVTLRRLPYVPGNAAEVKGTDRLDIMAHRKYRDGTKFWHIADANTELEANRLVAGGHPDNLLIPEGTRYLLVPED